MKCCTSCKRPFHVKCARDRDEEGVRTRSGGWLCRDCRKAGGNSAHGSNSSTSSTQISKEFLIKVTEGLKNDIFEEIKTFRKEISELQESMNFLSNSVDTANGLMKSMQESVVSLNKETKELRAENKELKAEVEEMREKMRALEQYSRRTNVEISGIPQTAGENPIQIVKDVGKVLNIVVEESQIAAAHRIPSFKRDRVPSMVVQFQQKATRDVWITKYKEKKTVDAKEVNSAFPSQKVFINEHLSPENKVFLAKLKAKSRELGYEYSWCRDGKFFVRKSSGERCRRINNQRELDQLK